MSRSETRVRLVNKPLAVLVIDDDRDQVGELGELLTSLGHVVYGLDDASFIGDNDYRIFDLVICDLVMPKTDGFAVIKRLATLPKSPCVIFISGQEPELIAAAVRDARQLRLSVLAVLRKPLEFDELEALLIKLALDGPPSAVVAPASFASPIVRTDAGIHAEQDLADWMAVAQPTLWPALLYAPRVNVRSAKTIGFEAVLNWHLPGWGEVPATDQVKIAEQAGLMATMLKCGTQQIVKVLVEVKQLPVEALLQMPMTVLQQEGPISEVCQACWQGQVRPSQITFVVDYAEVQRAEAAGGLAFGRLRMAGFGTALMVSATGIGDLLAFDADLPLTELRLGGAILEAVARDDNLGRAVAALISAARKKHLKVSATDADTTERLLLLQSLGVERVQGLAVSAPVSGPEFIARVSRDNPFVTGLYST